MRHRNWGYVYRTRRRPDDYRTRFFTFSCNHRESLFRSTVLKDHFSTHLHETARRMMVELIAWVLMPNHVHLLVTLGNTRARDFLQETKSSFARAVIARWRQDREEIITRLATCKGTAFWLPGGGHDEPIMSPEQLASTIDYIHLNPVRWNLVTKSVDWPWSSAREFAARELEYQRVVESRIQIPEKYGT